MNEIFLYYRKLLQSGKLLTPHDTFYYANELPDHHEIEDAIFYDELFLTSKDSTVTLAGEVNLTAGDAINLFYDANDLSLALTLRGANSDDIVWSWHRIS